MSADAAPMPACCAWPLPSRIISWAPRAPGYAAHASAVRVGKEVASGVPLRPPLLEGLPAAAGVYMLGLPAPLGCRMG